jgi:aryl-alcohol dehydrogenase-like predicted oxidoreductase
VQYRILGKSGYKVSAISFGAWAIGGAWGPTDDNQSLRALNRAVDLGVNFFDTADVYGDGRSEALIAQLRQGRSEELIVATKAGRRLNPHVPDGYNRGNLAAFVERSLRNLRASALDLLQLHCPPTDVYYRPEVFEILDDLVKQGKVRHYGVSVERVEEGLKAIEYSGVSSVQIIFNILRQRPAETFFQAAQRKNVGIIARVPLASGLLAGKMSKGSTFAPDDHRAFNRHGQAFDRGETFCGVDFEYALDVVDSLRALVAPETTMAQFALRWILMQPEVSCVIPGAKRVDQVDENCSAADLPPIASDTMAAVRSLYDKDVRAHVHQYW